MHRIEYKNVYKLTKNVAEDAIGEFELKKQHEES